jgi:predicted N-acyltransferase
MRGIVADFLAREGEAMLDYEAETARHLPYKSQSL